jgi:hypothetical protein
MLRVDLSLPAEHHAQAVCLFAHQAKHLGVFDRSHDVLGRGLGKGEMIFLEIRSLIVKEQHDAEHLTLRSEGEGQNRLAVVRSPRIGLPSRVIIDTG